MEIPWGFRRGDSTEGGRRASLNYGTRPLFFNSAIEPPRGVDSGLRVLFFSSFVFSAELRTKSLFFGFP